MGDRLSKQIDNAQIKNFSELSSVKVILLNVGELTYSYALCIWATSTTTSLKKYKTLCKITLS